MKFFRKKPLKKYTAFISGVLLTVVCITFIQAKRTDSYFEVSKNLDIFSAILKELNTYYVDPIEPGEMIKNGADAMLDNLDPYTVYITESDMEDYEFQTTGKYGGIGTTMKKKEDRIYIGEVYEFSPAQKAGLKPGDEVLKIDNQSIIGKGIDDISVLLKGAPGTQVVLTIQQAYTSEQKDVIVTRGEIELTSVPYAGLVGDDNSVAYVKLTQFTPACSRLVKNALDSLKKVKPELTGVVLDLRNNPGGLLNEAVSVCNLFVDKGQLIVSTKSRLRESDQDFKTTAQPWDTKIPVSVLINRSSASASEIVSGSLQDLDRGVIVGERSYGKGLVQITRPVGYNAKLKLTTAKYYTPSGRCIQALDYSNRNPDGSVGKIPDSLKKEYKTKTGRKVLSGGGVEPDVEIEDEQLSKLAITLYIKNYFFDYATEYAKKHNEIPPATDFNLSDAEFNAFTQWVIGKDYTYKSQSEIVLDSLKEVAKREKYYDQIKDSYAKLESELKHDKKQDLVKHKKEVTDFLESEIISRYYYIRGRVEHSLQDDNDLKQALSYIKDQNKYKSILKP